MLELLRDVPDAFGPKRATEIGAVTLTRAPPGEISFKAPAAMALVLFTPQHKREVALNSDRKQVFMAPAGSLEIIPAGSDLFARWINHKENLLMAFAPDKLSQLAGTEFQNENFTLQPPKPGTVDPTLSVLAKLQRDEFRQRHVVSDICLDTLATMFGVYLLRAHSSLSKQSHQLARGGLSPRAWRSVTDYIEANLATNLSIVALARVAELSPSHFLRAFRQSFGKAPYQYVLSRRLAHAVRLAKETNMPFADIAKASGFSSHSHMTATVKRLLGTTPRSLRRDD